MVTYVQIGKNPRMTINDSVKNIRLDFIKQIPSWKTLKPVYFYSSKSAKDNESIGILIPYRWRGQTNNKIYTWFYWLGEYNYWYVDEDTGRMTKVHYGSGGYSKLSKLREEYAKKGYKI